MLTKLILKSYEIIMEVLLWLLLFTVIIGGIIMGQNMPLYYINIDIGPNGSSVVYVIMGVLMWLMSSTFIVGAFLVLSDIRKRVENIESRK